MPRVCVNQTFRDFEIILINDGSTDGSDLKCLEWAKKDQRVIYISKRNEGPGPTRNCGIRVARYDHIAFLDSDDWWDLTMLEKMYASAVKNDSDMVICGYCNVTLDDDGQIVSRVPCKEPIMFEAVAGQNATDSVRFLQLITENGATARLLKKKLFTLNNTWFPEGFYEDPATMPYIFACCESVSCVRAPLYYYFRNRPGNTTSSATAPRTMIDCLESARALFVRGGKIDKYYEALKRRAYDHIVTHMRAIPKFRTVNNADMWDRVIAGSREFLERHYPNSYKKVFILGSYNLLRSVRYGFPSLDEQRCHIMHSSIISMFAPSIHAGVKHPNHWREMWVNMDLQKKALDEFSSKDEGDCVFIDFLDERYDIAKCGNSYFTLSDAFADVAESFALPYERISRFDSRVGSMWRECCDRFALFIKGKFEPSKVFLVKMYLSDYQGEYEKERPFDNLEEIRRVNALLEGYYDYFCGCMTGINVVECRDMPTFFTDSSFEFGGFPHHLNIGLYSALGEKLRSLGKTKGINQ
jgi:glycosyltransferase involved in cell wall biosynthesis